MTDMIVLFSLAALTTLGFLAMNRKEKALAPVRIKRNQDQKR